MKIRAHGHRGARARLPENTIPGFEYAIGAGVDAIELDVAVTRDGVVVVSHDPAPNREICQGPTPPAPIRTLTWSELRRWDCGSRQNPAFPSQTPIPGTRIPSLHEVFALSSRGQFDLHIETKIFADHPEYAPAPAEFAELVLDCIRRHRLESRAVLLSFDFRTLHAMRALSPEIRLSALYEGGADDFAGIAARAGARIVSPEKSLVTAARVKAAHEAGLQVVAWTANTPDEWDAVAAAGVDAIVSDDPAGLIAYLSEKNLR
jgi:glycerophosphoryl diester phosphodiesterase